MIGRKENIENDGEKVGVEINVEDLEEIGEDEGEKIALTQNLYRLAHDGGGRRSGGGGGG